MTVKEYLSHIPELKVDHEKVEEIEDLYGTDLPETVRKIISNCDEPLFIGDYRVLSYAEIRDAEDDLEVTFSDIGIIPLVDCKDNDFIVYNFETEKWSMFNIVDECSFMVRPGLEDIFGELTEQN